MLRVSKILILAVFLVSCNEYNQADKWGEMISHEIPKNEVKSLNLKNCEYNNKYFEKVIPTTFKDRKIQIVGVSSKSCSVENSAIVAIIHYYALIKDEKYAEPHFASEKIRIITPAYTALISGNYSYYLDFKHGKKQQNIVFKKNNDGSININSKHLTGK